ncbi:MAG: FAD-dependent monooxygenase [Pseudomonadota bacterium]|nr:FAD-dependent monooxygenase [Pseudomonadota bacterium]
MKVHDVVIVGGGPAGISTALHLHARDPSLAERTLVLEKERYPREKYCAGGVGGRALKTLARIGVHVDVPSVPVTTVAMRTSRETATMSEPGLGQVVRRIEFDHALARVAMDRGIAVREGAGVRDVVATADGVRLVLADGETVLAKVVVGADGVGGVVRRSLGLSGGTLRAQVIECDTDAVATDLPRDTLLFDWSDRSLNGYGWDFPTLVGGQERVCRGMYVIRALGPDNVHDRLRAYLAARGLRMEDYKLKPFGERGFEPGEPISKPRALLVGEAAGIDIATGEGIAQAIQHGEVAAGALSRAFRTGRFEFADWKRTVLASRFGRGLFARLVMYRTFYLHRARAEQALLDNPSFLQLFAQDFAGNRLRLRTFLRAAAAAQPQDVPWLAQMVRDAARGAPHVRTEDAA